MRVKRGTTRHNKHKKVLKEAKGYQGRRKSVFKLAKQAVMKAGLYSYRHRKNKKREFRALWIVRLNAAVRGFDLSYSQFIAKLKAKKIDINRKILADLATNNPETFAEIVKKIK